MLAPKVWWYFSSWLESVNIFMCIKEKTNLCWLDYNLKWSASLEITTDAAFLLFNDFNHRDRGSRILYPYGDQCILT